MRFGGLSYVVKYQILLKLADLYIGAVDCQFELKLVCGNREFPFFRAVQNNMQKGRL